MRYLAKAGMPSSSELCLVCSWSRQMVLRKKAGACLLGYEFEAGRPGAHEAILVTSLGILRVRAHLSCTQ